MGNLSTSRLKAESSRLATRTLQSDNDEALVLEQQQNDLCKIAIRRFQLPKIEKCNYLGQVMSLSLPRMASAPCTCLPHVHMFIFWKLASLQMIEATLI
jgi:hypothetical protein